MNVSISHPTGRPNYSVVVIAGMTFWFSYRTCIGFQADGPIVASENVWGPTTGKHLNEFSNKANRVPRAEFERMLADVEVMVATVVHD